MRKLLLIAGLAALGLAQEKKTPAPAEPVEVKVTLVPGRANDEARLGYSKARVVTLETNAPRFLFEVPKFKSNEPLFFRVALGESKGVPFYGALDQSGKTGLYDLLYLDRDRDLDMANDGKPVEARVRTLFSTNQKVVEFLDIDLDLPFTRLGKESTEPYGCVFFFLVDGKKRPLTIQLERDGWRVGKVTLKDGTSYRIVLIDDNCDGQYTTSDAWAMKDESVELKTLLQFDATRSMLFPSWTKDQKWTLDVKSVDPGGSELIMTEKSAKETEHDFFLRIYKQRQPVEEKALDIDPMRPKAGKNQTIDWLEGRGAKWAIDVANSPNVKRPVLLFFASNANAMSVQMDKYAFRDREVVALAKRFVCAKIDASKMKGDMNKYGVDRIPMIVFLTQEGTEISRTRAGFIKPRNLAADMKAALR